jgi:GPH family glycoside/pentoside/hexuronide:cation symporter
LLKLRHFHLKTKREYLLNINSGKQQPRSESGIGAWLYAGYGVGMVGERIFRDAPALLLLVFMTNYLAIPAALAGLVVFLPKIAMLVLDPLVGSISDRLRTRWGRRRPLMLLGALLTTGTFILLFHPPGFATVSARALYMGCMVTLGFAAYAVYSVPYLTMASEMALTAEERSRIMSVRVAFMAVGLTVGAYAGGIAQWAGGGVGGYHAMAAILGTVILLTTLTTVLATARARHRDVDDKPLGLLGGFVLVWRNRSYCRLLSVGFLQKLGEGLGYGSFAYLCIYVVHQPLSAMGLVVLAATVGQIASQPLWVWLSRRWPRVGVYTVGVLGWCLNLLLWLGMDRQPTWLLIPLGLQAGISGGALLSSTLSMLADAINAESETEGVNREGLFSGLWLAAEKLAFALGALIVGLMLGAAGFIETTDGLTIAQPHSAIVAIAITYVGINGLVYISSLWPAWRYQRGMTRAATVVASPVLMTD